MRPSVADWRVQTPEKRATGWRRGFHQVGAKGFSVFTLVSLRELFKHRFLSTASEDFNSPGLRKRPRIPYFTSKPSNYRVTLRKR